MSTVYTSKKTAFNNAEQFKESFSEPSATVGYVFLGESNEWANESSPTTINDSVYSEKFIWNTMFAAKKVTGNDVELVAPRINWTANTKYRQYDDTSDFNTLLTANTTLNLKPMYVITTDRNVYKCLSNNVSANSTVEPTGDYTTSNGIIQTSDGYLWKYMYNVKRTNRFFTVDWIPAPITVDQSEYSSSISNLIDGGLSSIIVTNSGSGYNNPVVVVQPFANGNSTLILANTTNVVANMAVSGTGILNGTYITSVDTGTNRITLSVPSISSGGGTGNDLTLSTRVYVDGDGSGLVATPTLNVSTSGIDKVTVTTTGVGYSTANVVIYGPGVNATARAILPPKKGHGFNPAKEIGASNVLISVKIGDVDASENGLISTDTSFRSFGFLRDPHKYGSNVAISSSNANNVISQTTNIDVTAGTAYTLNEFVYQGNSGNPTFCGFVHAQSGNTIRLINVKGSPVVGGSLFGLTSSVSRPITSITRPEFEPYTGDILYAENTTKIQRSEGQAENVRLVISF